MSKSEQPKEIRLEIRLPQSGYAKTMLFNRFRVEREEGFCVVHFGLVSKGGLLLDYYSCVLPRRTLEENHGRLLDYLERIGPAKEKLTAWQGAVAGQTPHVADTVSMAFTGDTAETCFGVFSLVAAFVPRGVASDGLHEAQGLALLRSSLEMQKQLIRALYEE